MLLVMYFIAGVVLGALKATLKYMCLMMIGLVLIGAVISIQKNGFDTVVVQLIVYGK